MKNAKYSFENLSDEEKKIFEDSIKDDYNSLLQIQTTRSDNSSGSIFEDQIKYRILDEDRLEEIANIYAEIRYTNKELAKKLRTLASLMVIESGNYFLMQGRVKNMHKKYPEYCSIEEMWSIFTKCFDSYDPNYTLGKEQSDLNEFNETENNPVKRNRFVAYFKDSLYQRFVNLYNKRENNIVLHKDGYDKKTYGTTISVEQSFENDEGDSNFPQIEDPTDYISAYDAIDAKVYLFSNLITKIMEHLGTDGRKANDSIKRMYKAFYTGDTIAFAKCDELEVFYNSMCRSQNRILGSCLDDFFNFILSSCETPKSIEKIKYSKIKTYEELNSAVFKNKDPKETPVLYIPTEENNDKRFGFENLVYAAFSNSTGSNITGQIKKYDDFRNKYFFKCDR